MWMWLGLTTTHRQTWLFSSTSAYHSTDLLTAHDWTALEACCRPWTWWYNDATAPAGYATTMTCQATCPNTEMCRRDRRRDSEVRPICCSTSSFRTRSYHRIPNSCLRHFWWKASGVLTSADSNKVQVYSNTDNRSVCYDTELRHRVATTTTTVVRRSTGSRC